ncbi:ABC transporter permease [bacterium]|nr:ABC transporter permease [bacterium]
MASYFVKRLTLLVPVLLTVATLVFFLMRLIPGDPVDFILGENALPTDRAKLVEAQHFDKPVFEQYTLYLKDLIKGDLGVSFFGQKKVTTLIAERYPATLQLAIMAMCWGMMIAFPLGLLSALKKGQISDKLGLFFSLLGISLPGFYLGPLLVLAFSIRLDLLPVSGRELPGSVILPSLTMGLGLAAFLTRMIRSSVLDVMKLDYVRTARAKGLSFYKILLKHIVRTALVPVVAVMGLQFGTLLAGAIITEKIFSWPGLGSLLIENISRRDYSVVEGCVMVIAVSYVLVNLITDIIYTKLDPRIELK